MHDLLAQLVDAPITDADEGTSSALFLSEHAFRFCIHADMPLTETYALFTQTQPPARHLGFVDGRAAHLELCVDGRDLRIRQAQGLLTSDRAGGTTGAGMFDCVAGALLGAVCWMLGSRFTCSALANCAIAGHLPGVGRAVGGLVDAGE